MCGVRPEDDKVAEWQVFHFNVLSALLKVFGDPDWEVVAEMAEGVNLGVTEPLPRTPEVFEEKGSGA